MVKHSQHRMVQAQSTATEYLKLSAVLIAILLVSLLLHKNLGTTGLSDFLRWFMGVFFVVFASFKFVGYKMFAEMYAGYDIVAKRYKIYGYAYPFIEFGLGVLYLTNIFSLSRDIFTLFIMTIGSIGVYHELKRRSGIHCACLGNIIKLPLGTVSLVEDLGMGIMAILMIML